MAAGAPSVGLAALLEGQGVPLVCRRPVRRLPQRTLQPCAGFWSFTRRTGVRTNPPPSPNPRHKKSRPSLPLPHTPPPLPAFPLYRHCAQLPTALWHNTPVRTSKPSNYPTCPTLSQIEAIIDHCIGTREKNLCTGPRRPTERNLDLFERGGKPALSHATSKIPSGSTPCHHPTIPPSLPWGWGSRPVG